MKKFLSMLIAWALVSTASPGLVKAADPKPIAALTAASYNDLLGDVNYVGKLIDRPELGGALEGLLAIVTQGKGLAGIDKTRPSGVVALAGDDEDFTGYVFLPVTNFKETLSLLELYSSVESQGEVYKLTPKNEGKTVYVKKQGAWACFADRPETLAQCGKDPGAVLGNLKQNYIVAGRLFLANVPAGLRQKMIDGLHQGMANEAEKKDDESDEQFGQRKKLLEKTEPYLVRVTEELDQVVFGWGLDRAAEKTFVDVIVTAKPGTKTAEEMEMASKAMTCFAGFRSPDAAFSAGLAGPIPPAKQEIGASLIEVIRGKALADNAKKNTDEAKRAVGKEVVNDVFDLWQKLVKSGRMDGAASLTLGTKTVTGLLAGYVADGALLDKILHTIARQALKEHPELEQFVKLDAQTRGEIHMHKISIPLDKAKPDQKKLAELVGSSMDVVIGVGKEQAYVAAGHDAEANLEQAVATSQSSGPKPVLPLEISLAATPVAGFVAQVGESKDRSKAAMAATDLKKTPGQDHIRLTVRTIDNGVKVHLEVEQGLVRLVGRFAAGEGKNTAPKSSSPEF